MHTPKNLALFPTDESSHLTTSFQTILSALKRMNTTGFWNFWITKMQTNPQLDSTFAVRNPAAENQVAGSFDLIQPANRGYVRGGFQEFRI